jgi:hypothetical protein
MESRQTPESDEPVVRKAGGGHHWLAIGAGDGTLRIGVLANSEAEARDRYQRSVKAWAVLINSASNAADQEPMRPALG